MTTAGVGWQAVAKHKTILVVALGRAADLPPSYSSEKGHQMPTPINLNEKASPAEEKKLIEEMKLLIQKKGLHVKLVETEGPAVAGQAACSTCGICSCMIQN